MLKLILSIAAVIRSAAKRNSSLLFWILFILMFLMAAGNIHSPDKDAYRMYYSVIEKPNLKEGIEIGFQCLIWLARRCNLTFEGFLAVYVAICFFLLFRLLNRLSFNKTMVLSLYLLFPFILDADQLRSFLAQLIVMIALSDLLQEKKTSVFRFVVLVAFASLFQQSAAIFLVYALVLLNERKVIVCSLVLAAVLLFGPYLIPLIASRFPVFNLQRVSDYFLKREGKGLWPVYAAFYLAIIGMTVFYTATKRQKGKMWELENVLLHRNHMKFGRLDSETLEKLNIISLILITLIPLNPHFERLLRPILLLDYISLSNMIGSRVRYKHEYVIIMTLYALCFGRFATYMLGGGWQSYIQPLFIYGSLI